jgi:hypothetical protein
MNTRLKIFQKVYDGESIYDLDRDVTEALQTHYNPVMKSIPKDGDGFPKGNFTVTVAWESADPT